LLRAGGRAWTSYIIAARRSGPHGISALHVLEQQLGLLSYEALAQAQLDLEGWRALGYSVVPLSHPDYPENLRVVENRPPILFVAGKLDAADRRAVSVIGTREPTVEGTRVAGEIAHALITAGHPVVSGLAAGIDTAAHRVVLELRAGESARNARTLAVIGTGLGHTYPLENADLQASIARTGAVISQFWPDAGPTRQSFPARNAVMSGITLGSVIVEASEHSGTRIQARHALAQGRAVVLMESVLGCEWARELADQAGVTVAQDAADVINVFRI
jgi:DNA processing protein